MKSPANEVETPPGSWTYKDPRTGMSFSDFSLSAIETRVYKAWQANGIEMPESWQAVIRHEICEQRPDIECREIGEPERFTTFEDVSRFASTLKNWLSQGAHWVPQEEAERRAAICVSCPHNKASRLCLACSSLAWLAERAGMPSTSKDAELRNCSVCGCVSKIAVHVPKDALNVEGLMFPSHCWKA